MSRARLPRDIGDARVVIAVVLGTMGAAWLSVGGLEAEPFPTVAALRATPDSFRALILEPAIPSRGRALLGTILGMPEPALPNGIRPIATMLFGGPSGEHRVFLVPTSVAVQSGLAGVAHGALTVVPAHPAGGVADMAEAQAVSLPRDVVRFLRRTPSSDLRVLSRTQWFTTRFPPLQLPPSAPEFIALTVAETGSTFRLRGIGAGAHASLALLPALLSDRPAGTMVLLDGVPFSSLFPPELPPVLEALATASGVGAELAELRKTLHDVPAFLLLRAGPHAFPDVVVGFRRPAAQHSPEAVDALVQKLLIGVGARRAVERVRVRADGRPIYHFRLRQGAPQTVQETDDGAWRFREVLGPPPTLAAALGADTVLLGTSAESVRDARGSLLAESRRSSRRSLRVFFDSGLLRAQPVFALVRRGISPQALRWLEAVGILDLRGTAEKEQFTFSATLELTPALRLTSRDSRGVDNGDSEKGSVHLQRRKQH